MKRWAALTVLLYLIALAALTLPLLLIAFGNWSSGDAQGISWQKAFTTYQEWGYWVWLAVMALGQALLLFTPIAIAERRPVARRPLFVPVITAAFFLANLLLAAVLSLLCAIFKEKPFDFFAFSGEAIRIGAAEGTPTLDYVFGMLTVMIVLWLIWAAIFYRFARNDDPNALVKRITRWLLRGSILELLVAVPSHIIVRHRNDCCAPAGTFWGIVTGLSIMILSFGPGVFFLFAARVERLRPKPVEEYDTTVDT